MTYAIFFVLVCMGPVAMICDDLSWIPNRIPRVAQQCINLGDNLVGECTISPVVSSEVKGYLNTNTCTSLKCAKPKRGGGHELRRHGRPLDGTICGFLKACKGGSCVDIPPHRIPIAEGSTATFDCRP